MPTYEANSSLLSLYEPFRNKQSSYAQVYPQKLGSQKPGPSASSIITNNYYVGYAVKLPVKIQSVPMKYQRPAPFPLRPASDRISLQPTTHEQPSCVPRHLRSPPAPRPGHFIFPSYVSRPRKGKVISPGETGILSSDWSATAASVATGFCRKKEGYP